MNKIGPEDSSLVAIKRVWMRSVEGLILGNTVTEQDRAVGV